MTDETGSPAGSEAVSLPADAPESFNSVSEATSYLAALREKRETPAESAEAATAETESEARAEGAPPDEGTSAEDQAGDPEIPAIEPPRSWSKDAHERWSKLDRETQEFLASRDSEDQKAIKRSLNEAAESRKAAEAERNQAGELVKSLAAKLPEMEAAVQEYLSHKYPEFKTYDDVVQMARQADALSGTDPFTALQLGNRVKAWEVDQARIGNQLKTAREAADNLAKQKQSDWAKFVKNESDAFSEAVPEFKAKEAEYGKKAGDMLRELGFTEDELNKLVSGEEKIPLFDRRMQRLLFDRIRLSEIKSAPLKAAPKGLPPVQRPGTSKPAGSANSERIQALTKELNSTGSLKAAQELRALQVGQRRAS